jgi:hypothetical protein
MSELEDKTVQKYFLALRELRAILKHGGNVALLKFCEEKGLSKNANTQLVQGGILKNIGGRGLSANWKWNTIEPNMMMAKETLDRCNNVGREAMRKSRSEPITRGGAREGAGRKKGSKNAPPRPKSIVETSILFGLIKIKRTRHD